VIELTLDAALERAAERWAQAEGWVIGDDRVTFAEMRAGALRMASALAERGVRAGDTVAVWLPNGRLWGELLFACSRLGAILVALNTRAKAAEAAYVLADAQAKAVVYRPRFLNIDFEALLAEIDPRLGACLSNADSQAPHWLQLDGTAPAMPVAELGGDSFEPADRRPGDAVLLQYTSGTTAHPKGALLSNVFALNYGGTLWRRLGVQAGESVLSPQPLYHVGGSCGALTPPLLIGCCVVMPEYYEPEPVLRLIERERCVARGGMPTMYLRELAHPRFADYDTSSLRAGWTIGDPGIMDRIRSEYALEGLIQIYGATEGGVCYGDLEDPWELRRRSAGRPAAGTEFAILDPDTGARLPPGTTGEICFRGWATLMRYTGAAAGTEPRDADGFVHSGDLGHVDTEGRLYFDGRLKDMIKPGGENVAAPEVEAFLMGHPGVHQVAVIGVPDPDLGEAVMAVIEVAPGARLSEADVAAYCRGRIAGFRIPKHVRFVSEWPLTDSGKIAKRLLVERYAA
jgi:fatty-acyl-CoA synthase/long-chain acyl-CoA synthetase